MAPRFLGTPILAAICASLSSAGPTAANREGAASATVSVTFRPDVMFERPIIGLAPWLWPPKESSRWDELRPLLEYMNFQAYHFHVGPMVYTREIDRGPEPLDGEGLAGRLHRRTDLPADDLFGGFLRAMRFARDSGASLHFIMARPPVAPFQGLAYGTSFPDHMEPFNTRALASYTAEFIRYLRFEEDLRVQIMNTLDEPSWCFRHWSENLYPEYDFDSLWALFPEAWDSYYVFLDRQLRRRGARAGVNLQMHSDGYPGDWIKKDGKPFNNVRHLLTQPEVTRAANGLCLLNYRGPDHALEVIRRARKDMREPGAVRRRISFKDMGGIRIEDASPREEFEFALDSIVGTLRAFRKGVDFCAQYFFLKSERDSDPPHRQMFAVAWNGAHYGARRPLVPMALFTKTQSPHAHRLRDDVPGNIPGVDFLGLLNARDTAQEFRTYYFANRSARSITVRFTPARAHRFHRYWAEFGFDTGRTIRAEELGFVRSTSLLLPARSLTAVTEKVVADLNWPERAE